MSHAGKNNIFLTIFCDASYILTFFNQIWGSHFNFGPQIHSDSPQRAWMSNLSFVVNKEQSLRKLEKYAHFTTIEKEVALRNYQIS